MLNKLFVVALPNNCYYAARNTTSQSEPFATTNAKEAKLLAENQDGQVKTFVELTADELKTIEALRCGTAAIVGDIDPLNPIPPMSALSIEQPNSFTTVTTQQIKTASGKSKEFVEAAHSLRSALREATDLGLLDDLVGDCLSPDSINDVCDSLNRLIKNTAQPVSTKQSRDATLRHLWKCCGVLRGDIVEQLPEGDLIKGYLVELTQLVADLIECVSAD